jgi:phytoene desaturase
MPEVFDHFFTLMGTSAAEQLDLVKLDPGYRVLFEKGRRSRDLRSGAREHRAVRVHRTGRWRSPRPLPRLRQRHLRDGKKRFLYSTFASFAPLLRRMFSAGCRPWRACCCRACIRALAKTVRDPRLQQILGYPAVFLGSSPFQTPSMYHLMSHLDLTDGVYYPMGGFTRVIERIAALATDAGVEIRTSAPVRASLSRTAAVGVELRRWRCAAADIVVSTADLHHSETCP